MNKALLARAVELRHALHTHPEPGADIAEPMRASEDFGWYLRQAEGPLFLLGDGVDHPPLHSAGFDFPDALLETACALFRVLI